MDPVDALLQELADDPSDYERQGGSVLLQRQGRQFSLSLREVPAVGIVVEGETDGGRVTTAPLQVFVQQVLLDLPRLASQVVKTIERASVARPAKYVDGPAELVIGGNAVRWDNTLAQSRSFLSEQELGTTRLVQLTAGAGQGKTVLLEQLARETASAYVPDPYPAPFLLLVDLLGRYVGTVDDAIAGSLNNTYMFPGLTQRDVALCVRHRWIILALDGFDELVARVGARDAFQRVTELLDQLRGAGTVILSAREAFFELYQISAAIRSYLQPRSGSYSTSVLRLLPWKDLQGERVFSSLGSKEPQADLAALLGAFGDDREIVLHPFFLTRLASLWQRGERFEGAKGDASHRWRTEYIIQTYIDRETNLKWKSRDGSPLLSTDGHTAMLAGLAEEMWRSGAFRLSDDEVRLATQIALTPLDLPPVLVEEVVERAPTHAALTPRDRGFSFVHDRFFDYYLSLRIRQLLLEGDEGAETKVLEARELGPEVASWLDWLVKEQARDRQKALLHALGLSRGSSRSKTVEANLALLLGVLMAKQDEPCGVEKLSFVGDALRGRSYRSVTFKACEFWQLDASDTVFEHCSFVDCQFGELLISAKSRFSESVFTDCVLQAVEQQTGQVAYEPAQIQSILEEHGATVVRSADVEARKAFATRVSREVSDGVARVVRRSQRASDISHDEIEEELTPHGKKVIKAGLQSGVLREHDKATSGPRKEFVRFQVDRQLLLRGQAERTGDQRIDEFWRLLATAFPRRE